jgi:hypothetical protein
MFLEKAEVQGIEQTCYPENRLNAMKSRGGQTAFPSGEKNAMRVRTVHKLHINRVYNCSAYRFAV